MPIRHRELQLRVPWRWHDVMLLHNLISNRFHAQFHHLRRVLLLSLLCLVGAHALHVLLCNQNGAYRRKRVILVLLSRAHRELCALAAGWAIAISSADQTAKLLTLIGSRNMPSKMCKRPQNTSGIRNGACWLVPCTATVVVTDGCAPM